MKIPVFLVQLMLMEFVCRFFEGMSLDIMFHA